MSVLNSLGLNSSLGWFNKNESQRFLIFIDRVQKPDSFALPISIGPGSRAKARIKGTEGPSRLGEIPRLNSRKALTVIVLGFESVASCHNSGYHQMHRKQTAT